MCSRYKETYRYPSYIINYPNHKFEGQKYEWCIGMITLMDCVFFQGWRSFIIDW